VGARIGHRGPRLGHRDLAVHRLATPVGDRRRAGAESRRGVLLPPRPYLGIEAIRDLLSGHQTSTSTLGIVVTAASLLVMPALGVVKRRLGAVLGSGATTGEGIQNLMCAAQAGAVLLGLAATAAFGWSWLDPVIALLLAGWAVREGIEAWRGEDCC